MINKIKLYDFNWDDPSDTAKNNRNVRGKWMGFLAQEVAEFFPTMINAPRKFELEEDDPEYGKFDPDDIATWAVDQTATTPLLMKAIQELSAKVTALENA